MKQQHIDWVGVDDAMPDTYVEVLMLGHYPDERYPHIRLGRLQSAELGALFSDSTGTDFTVTHWAHVVLSVEYEALRLQPQMQEILHIKKAMDVLLARARALVDITYLSKETEEE